MGEPERVLGMGRGDGDDGAGELIDDETPDRREEADEAKPVERDHNEPVVVGLPLWSG